MGTLATTIIEVVVAGIREHDQPSVAYVETGKVDMTWGILDKLDDFVCFFDSATVALLIFEIMDETVKLISGLEILESQLSWPTALLMAVHSVSVTSS